jgi:hypothetical protein
VIRRLYPAYTFPPSKPVRSQITRSAGFLLQGGANMWILRAVCRQFAGCRMLVEAARQSRRHGYPGKPHFKRPRCTRRHVRVSVSRLALRPTRFLPQTLIRLSIPCGCVRPIAALGMQASRRSVPQGIGRMSVWGGENKETVGRAGLVFYPLRTLMRLALRDHVPYGLHVPSPRSS